MTRLADLAIGEQARVVRVDGSDEISVRLLEMGLTPGVVVACIGAAPFGDPLELQVRGYRLSVRGNEASRVEVEKL